MMQQPVYQQEQQGAQEQGQQMVLCPVRLVYETQMLVQPGDQIQPNQTILINQQNTPPWIQNRQVQNPVIYVQHMPTNYLPSPQQHIDQNQLYIQNYGYQNVPQMFVQNPQEQIRPLQMMPNVMPNIQTLPTNFTAMQNPRMVSNVASIPQQVNIVNAQNQNNTLNINRMIAPSQINPNEIINKPPEVVQNVYRHHMSGASVQEPRFPIQPTITMVPNNIQNIQRVPQTFDPNVNQIRPMQQNVTTNLQQSYPNTIFNVEDNRKVTTTANKGTNATNFNVVNPIPVAKNLPQTYRTIQPRTNQVRTSAPNLLPIQPPTTIQAQHTMPNIISMNNVPRKIMSSSTSVNTTFGNLKVEGNNFLLNRKRKSESPDDIHKKVSISNQTEAPIIIKQIQNESYSTTSADVGVNTSPIHRPSGRITINNMQITPLNPNAPNSKLIEELAKPVRNSIQVTQNIQVTEAQNVVRNMINIVPETVNEPLPTEKEKLVRNTVYVQARGRILTDKDNIHEPPKIDTVPISKPEPMLSLPIINPVVETKAINTEPSIILPVKNEKKPETSSTSSSKEVVKEKVEIKKEIIIKEKAEIKKEIIKEIPELKKEIINAVAKIQTHVGDTSKNKVKAEIKNEKKESASTEPPKEVNKIKTECKADVNVKAESKADVNLRAESKADLNLRAESKADLNLRAESKADVNLRAESKADLNLRAESKAEVNLRAESKADVNLRAESKADSKADAKVTAESSTEAQEDRGYILTHVLSGFVIQESNIAFPIRKPLKEKAFYNNSDEAKKEGKDGKREREFFKDNSKILDISHLNIKECENMQAEATNDSEQVEDDDNPFRQLSPTSVRTWTAEQLAAHLAKYNWNETVTVLQDHELDGESLSLVSKAQLVTIGVKEEHAEIICEFVKS